MNINGLLYRREDGSRFNQNSNLRIYEGINPPKEQYKGTNTTIPRSRMTENEFKLVQDEGVGLWPVKSTNVQSFDSGAEENHQGRVGDEEKQHYDEENYLVLDEENMQDLNLTERSWRSNKNVDISPIKE